MDLLFLILGVVSAAGGLYALALYGRYNLGVRIAAAKITGFEARKDKGFRLPVVRFENDQGEQVDHTARGIDQIAYMLSFVNEGDWTPISYRVEKPGEVRVYGHFYLVVAGVLLLPLLGALAYRAAAPLMSAQVLYVSALAGIVLGGWGILKLIQRRG